MDDRGYIRALLVVGVIVLIIYAIASLLASLFGY